MASLRKSTIENPLSQQEVLDYVAQNPDDVFMVQKKTISVKLKKNEQSRVIDTVVVARDGRKIHETSNVAQEGDGVDIRYCTDGSLDQYVKKPHKVAVSYNIDDGRHFAEVETAEKVAAHTKNNEIRKAFVVEDDLYLMSAWGKTQFVARGSIVTIVNNEAIGNNNPCDMVVHTPYGNGGKFLTEKAFIIRQDMLRLKLPMSKGVGKFLLVAGEEDAKRSLVYRVKEKHLIATVKQRVLKMKMRLLAWKEKTVTLLSANRIEKKIADKQNNRKS